MKYMKYTDFQSRDNLENRNNPDHRVTGRSGRYGLRGFTLMEMIVVIGIIAIISALFIPAASGYLTRSRLNTANANARVIFNSLQTVCQEYEFSDRSSDTSTFYGAKEMTFAGKDATLNLNQCALTFCAYDGRIRKAYVEIYGSWTGGGGLMHLYNTNPGAGAEIAPWDILTTLDDPGSTNGLMQRMNRLFDDNTTVPYIARIENYQVKSVITASGVTSDYLGGYPQKSTERGGFEPGKVTGVDSTKIPFRTDSTTYSLEDIIGNDTTFLFGETMERYQSSKW